MTKDGPFEGFINHRAHLSRGTVNFLPLKAHIQTSEHDDHDHDDGATRISLEKQTVWGPRAGIIFILFC